MRLINNILEERIINRMNTPFVPNYNSVLANIWDMSTYN